MGSSSLQDCKEFKGELFGICNLFRDLSDKLFTSEIIGSYGDHQKSGKKSYCVQEKCGEDHAILEKQMLHLPSMKEMENGVPPQSHLDLLDARKVGGLHDLGKCSWL